MNHTIRNQFLTVTAAEEGGELQSVLGADGTQYLWQGDAAYWGRRATNLFPFVGRLFDKTYTFEGKSYRLENPHGFVRDCVLTCTQESDTAMTFTLTESEKTLSVFPFPFRYEISYRLHENTLVYTYRVTNTGSGVLPFGLGGHPGFNVPLSGDAAFEDWKLTFSETGTPTRLFVTDAGHMNGEEAPYPLENGNTLPLRHHLFDQDAVILKDMAPAVTLHSEQDSHAVTVSYPQMKYLGIWHAAKTDAPFVCIEPWRTLPGRHGVTEDFMEKSDMVRLAPGEVYENCLTITVK